MNKTLTFYKRNFFFTIEDGVFVYKRILNIIGFFFLKNISILKHSIFSKISSESPSKRTFLKFLPDFEKIQLSFFLNHLQKILTIPH